MDNKNQGIVFSLRCIVGDLIKNFWIAIIIAGFVAMGTYLYAEASYKPVYTTTATYAVTTKGSAAAYYANFSTAKSIADVMMEIFTSSTLKGMVANDLGLKSFPGTITATLVPETTLINITSTAESPELAYRIMKSTLKLYPEISDYVVSNAVLDVVSEPYVPMAPSSRFTGKQQMKKNFEISFLVMLAVIVAFSVLSDRIKNENDAEKRLDAKVFGVVPVERKRFALKKTKKSILITNLSTSFYYVEQIKIIATKLEYELKRKGGKKIVFTSLLENEGKSTVASNVALALAQRGKKVLLADADLRKPAVYKVFERKKASDDGGIADYIKGNKKFDDIVKYEEDLNMYIACGRRKFENSTELLSSEMYRHFLEKAEKQFDYVIIDSAPFGVTADSETIAENADAILMVVGQNMSPAGMVNDAIDALSDSDGDLLGCVLNRADGNIAFGGNRYGYGYGYGYGSKAGYGGYKRSSGKEEV